MRVDGLVLSDDLIFFSRIEGSARAVGLSVRQVRNTAELLKLAAEAQPAGVVLDLHNPDLDVPALLTELRAVCSTMPRTVAYGSHVEAEILRSARRAGCDWVMPRSQFVRDLDGAIREWLTVAPRE